MPFLIENFRHLNVGASADPATGLLPRQHRNFWHYTTPDSHAIMLGLGYFNQLHTRRLLQIGDIIYTTASHDSSPLDIQCITVIVTALTPNVLLTLENVSSALFFSTVQALSPANNLENPLMSQTIGGGLVNTDGQQLELHAWGTSAANANNKTVRLMWGATQLLTSGAVASNAEVWEIRARIIRTSSTAQRFLAKMQRGTTFLAPVHGTAALNFALNNLLTIQVTCASSVAEDFAIRGWTIGLIG